MAFSPDGAMLICPSGNLEAARIAGDINSVTSLNGSTPSAENEEKGEDDKPEESEAPAAPGKLIVVLQICSYLIPPF